MKLRGVKDIKNLKGKKILVRVDYNVPLKSGRVVEDLKIKRTLDTIKYLLKNNAQVVLVSHLGRPGGKKVAKYSLRPVAKHLAKLLKKPVVFNQAKIGTKNFYDQIKKLKPGKVMLIENVRFYSDEKKNAPAFAKSLAKGFDYFINDAFAVSHREHASVVGVAKYLPAHAGLNLLMEVKNLSVIQKNPKRPLVVIIGGAKISTKTPVIKQYLPKAKHVLLGGGVVTNLLRASGCKVGSSMVDEAGVRAAKQLLKYFGKKICKPVDLVIGDTKTFRKVKTVNIDEACSVLCQKGRAIYDIGPETVKEYKKRLQGAKTIIWNGPLGLVEVLAFSRATNEIALAMARSRAKTYVGGGETLMVVNRLGLTQKFTFVSTGGGAMLKFLEGKKLPGLKILLKK